MIEMAMWVHSSVVRAADCRSAGPWFKSGCALLLVSLLYKAHPRRVCRLLAKQVFSVRVGSLLLCYHKNNIVSACQPLCGKVVVCNSQRPQDFKANGNSILDGIQYHFGAWTVWPSGLRRWLQAPVRKGVGSNPTAVTFDRPIMFDIATCLLGTLRASASAST